MNENNENNNVGLGLKMKYEGYVCKKGGIREQCVMNCPVRNEKELRETVDSTHHFHPKNESYQILLCIEWHLLS